MSPHDDSGASSSRSADLAHSILSPNEPLKNGRSRSNLKISNIINDSSTPLSLSPAAARPQYYEHDREEVTRILIQALGDMGHEKIAQDLATESGYQLETPNVSTLRASILDGSWTDAEKMIGEAYIQESLLDKSSSSDLVLKRGTVKNALIFQIRQQKFFELLGSQSTSKALSVLRSELTPLVKQIDESRLNFLTGLLMCSSPEAIKQKGGLPDTIEEARQKLLSSISRCISPTVMLPDKRLATLFSYFTENKAAACMYHTSRGTISLLEHHRCAEDQFPNELALELRFLEGQEIWQMRFNNSGTCLAAGSNNGRLVIWQTSNYTVLQDLALHDGGISNIGWSPDDTRLVTCSTDKTAKLVDVTSGITIRKLASFAEALSACAWAPDGQSFVVSSLDRNRGLATFNSAGEGTHEWRKNHRVEDMFISSDGQYVVAMSNQQHIYIYNRETTHLVHDYSLSFKPLSISASTSPEVLLINSQSGEIHYVDLVSGRKLRTFSGYLASDCIIRANFGGADEAYVLSGSDDGKVYVWHRAMGIQVRSLGLEAEAGEKALRVNSAYFHPTDPTIIASCNDAGIIRIWTNADKKRILQTWNPEAKPRPPLEITSANGNNYTNDDANNGHSNSSSYTNSSSNSNGNSHMLAENSRPSRNEYRRGFVRS
ncbi:hypothetical protein BROUX41_002189 [Berkeleyomyces rouxiae]|uniref:uncharacterized protein n=1 Tax=Berkeleyomyces rouxiae TaxID=2035830 RepID=UPI003B7CD8A4